jgi:hypothetical protein
MSVDHEITKRAADGTLTIAELRQFLDEFDKAAATPEYPANGHTLKVKVRSGFSGGIKSIAVKIPGGEAERQ